MNFIQKYVNISTSVVPLRYSPLCVIIYYVFRLYNCEYTDCVLKVNKRQFVCNKWKQ